MNVGRWFVDRPVFAAVLSVLIMVVGGIALGVLPVTQYPEVAPPTVSVTAQYPGANAQTVADTVAAPLEQEINGVDNMLYMSSQSTGDGRVQLTVTFALGTDVDEAQVLVQNRVAIAQARLPEEVRRIGVTVRKASPDLLMIVHYVSPDRSRDQLYMSNYIVSRVRDRVARIDGVGDLNVIGARDYAMRVWLDPNRVAELGMSAADVVNAIRSQNVEVAGGVLGQPPVPEGRAFQPTISLQGRLADPRAFENIVVRTGDDGRVARLAEVGRAELGAQDYEVNSYLSGEPAVAIAVQQRPGSNALATANRVIAELERQGRNLPSGMTYRVVFNPTEFIQESADELVRTIVEAVVLVVLVVLLFLQKWRAAVIPVLAIPVALVGTFAVMALLDYSINNLTLFGLVLAVGIVVDDAIVVVENVQHGIEAGLSPAEAARKTMSDVGGALVSVALVLAAVFVPTAFITGLTGQFFRQFAVTVASATALSALVSLTLSPALCARLLQGARRDGGEAADVPVDTSGPALLQAALALPRLFTRRFFAGFNRLFDDLGTGYGRFVRFAAAHTLPMLALYLLCIAGTAFGLLRVPLGFVPPVDSGQLFVNVQLPAGASLERTDAAVREAGALILQAPGIDSVIGFAGFGQATRARNPSQGALFVNLKSFDDRTAAALPRDKILADVRRRVSAVDGASINVSTPPAIRGIGTTGGFSLRVQDLDSQGPEALARATRELVAELNRDPRIASSFTPFTAAVPQLYADIDRSKARMLDIDPGVLFSTLAIYVGGAYVNDFNLLGRTYRVTAQAEAPFRSDANAVAGLKARANNGAMVPLGSVMTIRDAVGPDRVSRFNLYPAAEVQGEGAPGVSTGQVLAAVAQTADRALPDGFGYEWTDLSYQQVHAGNTAMLVFPLCVLFVFLVLAAQYESWSLPLAVILIVPMCLASAITGVALAGMDNNLLTQIGFVVLVGLAAKNAILIVEFARQLEGQGRLLVDAVVEACTLRLRPILMTSFAFILGVVPLLLSQGAGAELRRALGVAVFSGMLGVTVFGLIFTPVFYVCVRRMTQNRRMAVS